ncbi:MAG: hypothetical protein GX595_06505 [Lentisphaerae bacterium]|nr:hypothetical protein [Lentisphaerota bacterium]
MAADPAWPPSAHVRAVEPEIVWQLRRSRATAELDGIRRVYEGLRLLAGAAPDTVDQAERELARVVISLHRADAHADRAAVRSAAQRAGAVALFLLLDLAPEAPHDPL